MKKQIQTCLLLTSFAALPTLLEAQPTAHYLPGVEGIKGSSLPPPGIYFRDYNVFYWADRLNDVQGHENKPADAHAFIYGNIPRVLWITDQKFLGGFVGVDALVPLKYTHLKANTPGGPFNNSTFGIGDLFVEGTLSWHPKQFDFAFAYGIWAPTGDFAPMNPTLAGSGFWTHMFTAAATWYPDQGKKWAVSALSRYEINHEQQDTHITPGQAYTLEWGASYAVKPTIDVGVVGYYQVQTTGDSGGASTTARDNVVGVGPEISLVCPKTGIIASLRYVYEVSAADRLQGQIVALTLTKRF